jgi:hypothetical protein
VSIFNRYRRAGRLRQPVAEQFLDERIFCEQPLNACRGYLPLVLIRLYPHFGVCSTKARADFFAR